MLSRRTVRIKVLQLLYNLNRDSDLTFHQAKKLYWDQIDATFHLYLFNLYSFIQVAKESLEDDAKRKAKYLPTEEDRLFKPKLYDNPIIRYLDTNTELLKLFKKYEFGSKADKDLFKNLYNEYLKEASYQQFLREETDNERILEELLNLYRFCRKNSIFTELMEDHYFNWEDDNSVVIGATKKTIKACPNGNDRFFYDYYPEDETIKKFGETLLIKTFENDKYYSEMIGAQLANWDIDRVAIIDMILLKMAITEFLHFESIPVKVTINEYLDIAKLYSTPKSNEFINGVLVALQAKLESKNLIQKSGRGLLE